jgi:hypothetical protein
VGEGRISLDFRPFRIPLDTLRVLLKPGRARINQQQYRMVGGNPVRGEKRKAVRVQLEHRHPVNLVGVDGTWQRGCILLDVSASGAKVEVEGSTDVLRAKEFFLLLSSTGLAFRRCELAWIDGSQVGIRFINIDPKGRCPLGMNEAH